MTAKIDVETKEVSGHLMMIFTFVGFTKDDCLETFVENEKVVVRASNNSVCSEAKGAIPKGYQNQIKDVKWISESVMMVSLPEK